MCCSLKVAITEKENFFLLSQRKGAQLLHQQKCYVLPFRPDSPQHQVVRLAQQLCVELFEKLQELFGMY